MRIVVNHLRFKEPLEQSVVDAAAEVTRQLVDAGGDSAGFVQVDDTHAILVLAFPDLETEERVKSEIGGPWMREHILPRLASPTERSSGEVVAGAD